MFCSSKLKTTPRGSESPPSRDGTAPPNVATTSGVVDQPVSEQLMQIFVRGAPHQTHTLRLGLSDTMGDVSAEVERLGYDLSAGRLCRFGGASLPPDVFLTVAESGLRANSSLQVLGRLRGGDEVTLFEQQHSLGDTGLLDLQGKDVGPAKLKELAAFFSSPESAAVRHLVLSGNMITDRGKDLSGLKELCEVLSTLEHPISLDLANCGLGVAEVNEVATAIHAGAVVNSVTVDGNPIGCPSGASVKPGAATVVAVKKGVFAAVDGRFGEVTQDPDSDSDVKLRWLDDGSESSHTKVDKLTSVVASRTDLIEDYSHIRSLGEALSGSKVKTYGLANCEFNPVSLATFVELVRWADAVLTSINCLANKFGEEDLATLLTAIEGTSVRSLCGLTEGQTVADFSGQYLGPIDVKIMAAEYGFQGFIATLTSINCLNNPLGEEAQVIIKIFEETPRLRTLCGLEEGVQQIDWSESGKGPAGVALLAAELKAGRAAAAVARLMLDGNPLTGDTSSSDFDKDITSVMALFDSLKTSSVTELGLAKCRLGPGSLGKLAEYVRDAEAALTSINCLKNPIGDDGLATLVAAVKDSSVRSICGLVEGQTVADFSKQNLRPFDCKIIAAEFGFRGFIAAVASLNCSGNDAITGKRSRDNDGRAPWIYGEKPEGWIALCSSLSDSSITSLNFSGCQLNSKSLAPLSDAIKLMAASVEVVILDSNPIGFPSSVTLKPGAATEADVKKGAFGSKNGRFAEIHVLEDPNSDAEDDDEVEIRWLDNGEEDDIEMGELTSVVAFRTDLIEDYSHIRSLGEALSGSKVKTYGFANCNFNQVSLATFVDSVTWAEAAVKKVTLSQNFLFGSKLQFGNTVHDVDADQTGWSLLCESFKGSTIEELILRDVGMGVNGVASLAGAMKFMAVVASLRCGNNPGMVGKLNDYGNLETPDAHAEVFKELTDSLKTSQVTEADFSSCGIGPVALGHLGEWVREARAAIARLILDDNPLTGGRYDSHYDTDITAVFALFDTLKTSSVTELSLAKCRLGPGSLGKLAEYVREATAALASMVISRMSHNLGHYS
eukprot:COSAG02_NODE_1312_length_13319_cov_5.355371_5_plen_1065_part_00